MAATQAFSPLFLFFCEGLQPKFYLFSFHIEPLCCLGEVSP